MTARLYGCHNRAPLTRSGVFAPERDPRTGALLMTEIPFRFEPECQFTHTTLGQLDARCGDCEHRTTTPKDLIAS